MARSQVDLTGFTDAYRKYLNRDPEQQAIDEFNARPDVSLQRRTDEIINSPEYANLQRQKDIQITPLSTQDQQGFLNNANSLYAPLQQAGASKFAAYKNANAADFGDLKSRLQEDASNNTKGLEEGLNSRGLLYSGVNAANQGKIQRDLTNNIGRADIERAVKDADLVLQEAGYNTDLQGKIESKASQLADQEYGRRKQASDIGMANAQNRSTDLDNFYQREGFGLQQANGAQSLLTNPDFENILIDNPELAMQLLSKFSL